MEFKSVLKRKEIMNAYKRMCLYHEDLNLNVKDLAPTIGKVFTTCEIDYNNPEDLFWLGVYYDKELDIINK